MGDLLGEDYSLVEKNALYRSLDKLLFHKIGALRSLERALEGPLRGAVRPAAL